MRMKNHLKTKEMARQKVCKENNFNRNRSQKMWKQKEPRKLVPRENCVKRMVCGEKKMSREDGLKKKDAKRWGRQKKRRQRKAAEKTSVSRDSDDLRKTLSGEKSVPSLRLQSCQQEGLPNFRDVKGKHGQTGSREIGIIRQWCQEKDVSGK